MKQSKYRTRRLNNLWRLRSTAGDQWRYLYQEGKELHHEYHHERNPAHICEAVVIFQEALALCRRGNPHRSITLDYLASALEARYQLEGNVDDLSLAIACYQEHLALYPVEDPRRAFTLNNLANVLGARCSREGNLDDLSLSIAYHQEALALRPVGDPNRSYPLNNLAIALENRYKQTGNVDDLSLSIAYHEEALSLCPAGAPNRTASLNNLGNALVSRYIREGNANDHSIAMVYYQEALELHQFGHPDRFATLGNLAKALEVRYDREGNVDDLVLAITHRCEVLALTPPGHPLRSASLRTLAASYWIARNKEEAVAAIDLSHNAAARLLDTSSSHPQTEDAEHASIQHDSPDSLTMKIISLIREASRSENCSPIDWLQATLGWITYSKVIDPDSAMEAYTTAFRQLDVVLALGQSLEHRQGRLLSDKRIVRTRGLGDEAATWALQRGEPERAVEFLEQGRSLLLAQLGRYRTDLNDLRRVDSELAVEFEVISRRLDSTLASNVQIREENSPTSDPYERYRQVSIEWNHTVEQIRTLPNFDTFLKPASYNQLQKAAAEGPIIFIIPNEKSSDALILRAREAIHRVHLPLASSDRLTKLSNSFVEAVEADGQRAEKLCTAHLRSLWKKVVEPIAQALQSDLKVPLGSRIWWYPTSMTSFLPLHAAGLYSKGQTGENFPDLYTSSYTPTLQALLRARREATAIAPRKLLIVAQPATPDHSPLACAVEEAAVIQKIVSPTRDVEMLSAEAGTCEAVQLQMESHPWMHFICHGIQADGQPLNSYLALHDGPLTLRMIIKQNLPNADFAFLSACHSAAGDKVLANEALHLAAAMQFAGFRGVVGTLWEMADENGPPLAEAFYREMVKHGDSRGAAKALSEAVKQLRRNGVPLNLWMRFVHIGI